jgi:hypothetical protein
MMGSTDTVTVASHAQLRNAILDSTAQAVPVHRTHLASAAATDPVTPFMLEVVLPTTPTIVPSSVVKAIS